MQENKFNKKELEYYIRKFKSNRNELNLIGLIMILKNVNLFAIYEKNNVIKINNKYLCFSDEKYICDRFKGYKVKELDFYKICRVSLNDLDSYGIIVNYSNELEINLEKDLLKLIVENL